MILKQYVAELTSPPRVFVSTIVVCSWHYWVINPDQAVTDTKKSPQDPVLTLQQRAASLRRRSVDSRDPIHPRSEKSHPAASEGTGETQNGSPENRQEIV
jgi:hypothetical protein